MSDLLRDLRDAIRRLGEPMREPVHSDIVNSLLAVTLAGWFGGYIAGRTGSLTGIIAGTVVVVAAGYVALVNIPHPEVLLDCWQREKWEFEGGGDGDD